MTYRVELAQRARRAFLTLPKRERERIGQRLLDLQTNPRPRGVKALTGALKGHYRLRVGDCCIVYTIQDEKLLVLVVRVGPRRTIYDDLERGH